MKRNLPPLNAIKAFEAAGRLGSFSEAADELNVTQGAISKQVKSLEAHLNMLLFVRKSGCVSLTDEGRCFMENVGDALDSLDWATSKLKNVTDNKETLVVDVTHSFAAVWLMPRLRDFKQRNKNIQIKIITGDGRVNFCESRADCALRCMPLDAAPAQAELLFTENMVCVGNKSLLAETPVRHPQDLLKHRLIEHIARPNVWESVFQHFGLPSPKSQFSSAYAHFFLSLQAMKDAEGLCLLPDFMADFGPCLPDIDTALNLNIQSGFGYFWQSPTYKSSIRKVYVFYQWLGEALQMSRQIKSGMPSIRIDSRSFVMDSDAPPAKSSKVNVW